MPSIGRQIFLRLALTTIVTSLCAYGWIYWQALSTEGALRELALKDRAVAISDFLAIDADGKPAFNLPKRIADAYSQSADADRYAIRDGSGTILFSSGSSVAPLNRMGDQIYDYDPDGPGPIHMFGAAVRTKLGGQSFVTQVEHAGLDSEYHSAAVNQEFLIDGGLLQLPFLLTWLAVSVFAVRRALAPLKQISHAAECIDPAKADVRLPTEHAPAEIVPLVNAMNLALDRLEIGLRQQREFNADASHQLRTPLAILSANIESMQDRAAAAKLGYDVELMSRIVNQLLIVARLEALSKLHDEAVDLHAVATDVATNLAPIAVASGKHLEVVSEEQSILVRGNAEALRAVLTNLVENAVSHTLPGTTVSIYVTDGPAVEVIDSGPGVPGDQIDRIFDRFWKGDRNGKGAGLGLAIVKQIMGALQGTVSVTNIPDRGASFKLTFSRA
jgi:signal transduction histidine kinase